MAANRKEHNRNQTISDIEAAFLELYRRGGMDGVSIAMICKICAISRSTFYLYFDSKYAILQQAEQRLQAELLDICANLPSAFGGGDTTTIAVSIIRHLRKNIEWYKAILGSNGDPSFVFQWKREMRASLHPALLRHGIPEEEAAVREILFSSALTGLYTYIVFDCPDISGEELSRHMDDLLLHLLTHKK